MLKSRTLIRLVLVAVFLAVSMTGGVVGLPTTAESNTIQTGVYGEQPATVIACTTGDPGSTGGGCGGG